MDSVLHRLEKQSEIRRVISGIYDYPCFSKILDQKLSPDVDQVARALARKIRSRIQPSVATRLNLRKRIWVSKRCTLGHRSGT